MHILLIALLALGGGGGASLAAESAVPGNALYAMKVSVNEPVRGFLAFSSEAKANWDVRIAERRMEEAEKLANEGKLSADARAQIESNFALHAERVKERTEKLEANDNLEAAANVGARFETSLRAHERILARFTTSSEANMILIRVRTQANETAKSRAEMEMRFSEKAGANKESAARGRMTAAENKIREVTRFIAQTKTSLGATATADAEARLAIASTTVAQGKAMLDTKAYGEAFILFGRAHQTAQEAKLLIASRVRLNINIEIDSDDKREDAEAENNMEARIKSDSNGTEMEGSVRLEVDL